MMLYVLGATKAGQSCSPATNSQVVSWSSVHNFHPGTLTFPGWRRLGRSWMSTQMQTHWYFSVRISNTYFSSLRKLSDCPSRPHYSESYWTACIGPWVTSRASSLPCTSDVWYVPDFHHLWAFWESTMFFHMSTTCPHSAASINFRQLYCFGQWPRESISQWCLVASSIS